MKNIVLIVCDTLSAEHLPMYGYERDTAPFLSGLSVNNTIFKNAYANSIWTPTSHASIFSGKNPREHGMNSGNLYFNSNSFVEELAEKGYSTYAYSNNSLVSPELGFGKGFQKFRYGSEILQEAEGLETLAKVTRKDRKGDYSSSLEKYSDFVLKSIIGRDFKSLKQGLAFILSNKLSLPIKYSNEYDSGSAPTNKLIKKELRNEDQPFFLFINYTEPHAPYKPPPDYAEKYVQDYQTVKKKCEKEGVYDDPYELNMLKKSISNELHDNIVDLYDAEINYLDDQLRDLHDYISENKGDTIFIITSDHGESFGTNGIYGHQFAIEPEMIHVPLIVAGSEIESDTRKEDVSLKKVYDLVLDNKLENLGTDHIFSNYSGAHEFLLKYSDHDLEDFTEKQKSYVLNESRSVIQDGGLLIENTKLPDQQIKLESTEIDFRKLRQNLRSQNTVNIEQIDY